jgi:hypothetical protein
MNLIQKLSNSLLSKTKALLVLVSIFAIFGTILELSGGIWDAVFHVMQEPEFFWTIQHMTVYSDVALIGTSGIFGSILLFKKKKPKIILNSEF